MWVSEWGLCVVGRGRDLSEYLSHVSCPSVAFQTPPRALLRSQIAYRDEDSANHKCRSSSSHRHDH